MRIRLLCFAVTLLAVSNALLAQGVTTIQGNVKNSSSNENVPSVSVIIKGTQIGTYADEKGNFKLTTTQKPPFVVVFSSVGYDSFERTITSSNEQLKIFLQPAVALGQEIVVAASRTPERILESPVTVERVSASVIRNAPAASYYDVLGYLKGVDMTTSSLTFRTPSTRGFNGSGNLRFNQFVDGMDNQAPGLNFSVGSIVGLSELDVENMELLQGASSALYGSGGMNGTLLINSKSPFKYPGLSAQVKMGVNHIDNYQHKKSPVYDWSIRWAQKVSDKFAFKITSQFFQAQDWQASDSSNLDRNNVFSSLKSGTRATDPNYDGVNIYGDEASAKMNSFAQAVVSQVPAPALAQIQTLINAGYNFQQIAQMLGASPTTAPLVQYLPFIMGYGAGIYGDQSVSRTGYAEKHLTNYESYNYKIGAGLYYMITPKIEASVYGHFGTGTSVYTGADRYSLVNLKMAQYKFELKHKNWFIRAYTTQENSGDSYASTITSILLNREWKADQTWFQQYVGTYSQQRLTGQNDAVAHAAARSVADMGRYMPGTAQFNSAFNKVTSKPIGQGGSKFADQTDLYQIEGQVNLTDLVQNKVEVILGGSYRRYVLNSRGTIFADTAGRININEMGAYFQLQKKLFYDVLKLTVAGRFDKNENFDGRFTPRVSAVIKAAKDHNIRLSYQQAYRFPSTQDQYINLQTPGARLIGGLDQFNSFFNFNNIAPYTSESVVAFRNAVGNNVTPANLLANAGLLKPFTFATIKPETSNSFEVGYKGVIAKKLLLDAYVYYTEYKDFIGRVAVARGQSSIDPAAGPTQQVQAYGELYSPFTTTNYSLMKNHETPVKSLGWGVSAEYKVYKTYYINANIFGDELKDLEPGFTSFFNTPKLRYNIGVGNENVYKNFGFNVMMRWQDKVNWEGTFGSGEIPAYTTVDAQISYKMPEIKSMFKVGGTNILNKYYRSAFGNPKVGGLYYVSFAYNIF